METFDAGDTATTAAKAEEPAATATSSKVTNLGVAALLNHARSAPPEPPQPPRAPPPQPKHVPPARKRSKVSFKVRSSDVVTADSLQPLEEETTASHAFGHNVPGKKMGKGQRKVQQQQSLEELEAWNEEFQSWQQQSHPPSERQQHADGWAQDYGQHGEGYDGHDYARGGQHQRRQKKGHYPTSQGRGSVWDGQEEDHGGWSDLSHPNQNPKVQKKTWGGNGKEWANHSEQEARDKGGSGLRESVMNAPLSKSKAGVILPELVGQVHFVLIPCILNF